VLAANDVTVLPASSSGMVEVYTRQVDPERQAPGALA
jgi:hypothetical protein